MKFSLSEVNQMNREAFVTAFGAIFEESPWVAQQAWEKRPFADFAALHRGMVEVVQQATPEVQLALIQSHPDLGNKVQMSAESVREQAGVGLDRLTQQERDRFLSLNQAYKEKFHFPLIVAVKNHTKESILNSFASRLDNTRDAEIERALAEIAEIARFRLLDKVEKMSDAT
jgi:2-oxo-4-hydroxy-4-carboxy-5-ureidoimidazoline decarboxylase